MLYSSWTFNEFHHVSPIPSGKQTYGKSSFFMGKLTINHPFSSSQTVSLPEGNHVLSRGCFSLWQPFLEGHPGQRCWDSAPKCWCLGSLDWFKTIYIYIIIYIYIYLWSMHVCIHVITFIFIYKYMYVHGKTGIPSLFIQCLTFPPYPNKNDWS